MLANPAANYSGSETSSSNSLARARWELQLSGGELYASERENDERREIQREANRDEDRNQRAREDDYLLLNFDLDLNDADPLVLPLFFFSPLAPAAALASPFARCC